MLKRLRDYFRIKNIYNSNAIEGNLLNYQETRFVVEEGLTITGKPLKDTLEAKNLSHALTLFEELADRKAGPIIEADVRNLNAAILKGVNDRDAGKYREVEVMITGSPHKPPRPEAVAPEMQKFGEWLKNLTLPENASTEIDPILAACAAHSWFVYIHPFVDGNGRVARLLLNLALMRHGYPIAVITREDRQRYYETLRQSDEGGDLSGLVVLVLESVEESLDEYMAAAEQQQALQEWGKNLVSRFSEKEKVSVGNEHAVWASAMELLKSQFKQICDLLNQEAAFGLIRFWFKDYGSLEFEKFLSLRQHQAAKMTWGFGIQLRSGNRQRRFLFWYGFASFQMSKTLGPNHVTVHVSFADDEFQYQKIEDSSKQNLPNLCEIGYAPDKEQFFWRRRSGGINSGRIEVVAKKFFEEVAQKHF